MHTCKQKEKVEFVTLKHFYFDQLNFNKEDKKAFKAAMKSAKSEIEAVGKPIINDYYKKIKEFQSRPSEEKTNERIIKKFDISSHMNKLTSAIEKVTSNKKYTIKNMSISYNPDIISIKKENKKLFNVLPIPGVKSSSIDKIYVNGCIYFKPINPKEQEQNERTAPELEAPQPPSNDETPIMGTSSPNRTEDRPHAYKAWTYKETDITYENYYEEYSLSSLDSGSQNSIYKNTSEPEDFTSDPRMNTSHDQIHDEFYFTQDDAGEKASTRPTSTIGTSISSAAPASPEPRETAGTLANVSRETDDRAPNVTSRAAQEDIANDAISAPYGQKTYRRYDYYNTPKPAKRFPRENQPGNAETSHKWATQFSVNDGEGSSSNTLNIPIYDDQPTPELNNEQYAAPSTSRDSNIVELSCP